MAAQIAARPLRTSLVDIDPLHKPQSLEGRLVQLSMGISGKNQAAWCFAVLAYQFRRDVVDERDVRFNELGCVLGSMQRSEMIRCQSRRLSVPSQ